uniref:ankyrin repeat domain-containing protein 26-like n=1 Tax=Nyctereutes procyonoides TaxID=34880 RepID=UPI002445260F|nr:ankyrin repeat domain-containing protein 26-like [Nyctereutes procyonoides]
MKAVQCQEEACVDILLKKGADPNAKDFKGNTALHYAAFEGNISIAQKLLFNKGDIEAKNKDGLTPLLVAVNEKKEKMVAFLVEEANINAVDYAKRSALHLACANGHVDIVKLLIDRKCQLNLRDGENTTALMKAVQSQEEACVDILLKHGANPDVKDNKGNTALHYAAFGENVTIAQKVLLRKGNVEIKNKDGLTPLLVAVNEKKEKMVAFLVEEANINAVDYAKRSALHLACANGREDMVKLLVDRKCELNLRDGEDTTALMKAVQCQEEACVTLLLEHGADPNLKDNKGNTALHYAAREEIVSIAEKLLLQNANIEAKNTDGLTPVLVALNENKEQMVKFLVGKGARLLAGDMVKSSDQLISEHKEEMEPENSSQNHDLVATKSEEVALSSLIRKADTDDSRPSKHEDLSSDTKTVPKLNFRKLMAAFRRPKRAKCGLVSQEDRPLFADNNFSREDKTETLCKPSVSVSDSSPLAFVSPETPQTSLAMLGVTKAHSEREREAETQAEGEAGSMHREPDVGFDPGSPGSRPGPKAGAKPLCHPGIPEGATKPAIGKKDNGIDIIESPPQEQAVNDNLTSADRAHKNHMSDRISALGRGEDSSPWDSESISARLPKNSVDCLPGAADQQGQSIFNEQVEDSPGKDLLHWESTTKVKDSVPNEAVATSDKQTPRSDFSSEPDLEVASEQKQEQERPDKSENNHPQDKVILQTCILAEKTSESQTKQINIPLVQLQNMAREPEMNMECDRQGDRSVHSEHPRVHEKYEEIQMKQGKLDWKNNVKRMSRELKQKIGKTCKKYRITTHPKLEPLRGNSKEADLKEIPPNVTKVTLDCEEKDEFGVSVSLVPQAFPEQKEPCLENAILFHSYSGSPDYACQSSSKLSFHENDNKPGEHVFNKNESLDSDPENKKVRNPLVTFEVKEDQEFDMQMAESLNQNTTNSKLDTGYIPPYSDPESLFDLRLAHSNVAKQMIQKKRRDTSAIANTYKKTKPIRDSFQKPLYADNDSTNNYKSTEPALENVSSSPRPFRTSKVYQKEELQQDMQNLQRFKNEKDMLQVKLLALEKEKVELQKETGKERKQHKSSKMEGAENIHAAAAAVPAAGLIQQRKSGKTDYHLFPTTQNEDSDSNDPGLSIMEIKKDKNVKWASKASAITPGFEEADSLTGSLLRVSNDNSLSEMDQDERRPAKKTSKEKNKVKKQVKSVQHLDDLTQSSEAASEDSKLQYSDYESSLLLTELGMDYKDSVSVLTIRDAILKYERSIELKKKECEQLIRKILKVEYKVNGLEKLLSETKEMKSQLEHQKVEWERKLYSLRLTLKQEKEKRRSAEMLHINIKEQLRSKEELSEVSPPHEKEKGLLHENCMLQDEIAMLRLEIDTIKNQKQEKAKRYCEDTEIEKEKNDSLQNAIKLNDVTLTNTVFQSSGQLNVVTTENTMLNSKLQDEKLNRERLEAKLQSYRARLATAIQDRDQSQASKRDLELAFQRAKDEWCHLQDKMNFEMSNLKDNNEVLSQQLSEAESKFNALEIELQYTRDALREKTLALEHVQRNPKQTQGQKKEIEQKYQNEQGKVNKYIGKHESLEEKLSQLQSENMLLREQLDDAYSRVECKEKTRIDLEDQVQVIVRNIQAESEKRSLILQERNKELINECKHLMERVYTYEKEKEEREASPELSHYRINLEDEVQDLKTLDQIRSQIGDLRARLETESLRCLHLDAKNQVLQQELLSMKATERECEKLKQIKKKLEEEVVNLRSHAEVNVVEGSQVEKYYKWEIDQRARLIVEERLKEVNLFLQRRAASQENLEQLRASHDASIRSQVALRIKELESELQSKIRNSQELKIELEKYRQLYLEESEMRMSLTKKLSKTNERLEDTRYLVERQQNRPFHSTLNMGPVLEGPYVGNLTSSLLLDGNVTPRENVMIPTSRPQTSVSSIETHLIKMLQELEDNITRELKEVARELE